MKNILLLGCGAIGYTVIRHIISNKNVNKIFVVDVDEKILQIVKKISKKIFTYSIDCSKKNNIVALAKKCGSIHLLINTLPATLANPCLEAALTIKCDYQDFAIGFGVQTNDPIHEDWVGSAKYLKNYYHKKFSEIKKKAIIGCGVAPGLMCVLTRMAVEELDSCETINNFFYEGVDTKTFVPFWFSPETALIDMADRAVVFRNGKLGYVDAFTEPSYRKYKYMNREIEFLQHSHEEPIIYGINAKKYYKGLKNAYFKYAGVSMDFAKQINRCGLLIKENIKYKNLTINPLDFICSRIAKAPKYEDEVKKIIASGFYSDVIYAIVEVIGKKQNKKQVVEYHIFSPGLKESFAKRKLTSEQFLTGQSGAVYTDMMINDKISNLGLIFSDEMSISEMKYYLSEIKKLGIKCVKNISSKIPD